MAQLTRVIANFETQLTAKLAVGGTSINIQSATDKDGVALPAGKYCFTLDLGNSAEEHIIADLSGTALTNIKSVSRQAVQTTGAAREHRIGTKVKLTDFVNLKLMADMLAGLDSFNGLSPLSYDVEPTITDRKQFATSGYVLDVISGGVGTASPNTAGTIRTTHDQSTKPRAMATLVREQNTPDKTLLVAPLKHSEIDKIINFAGGNSPAFIDPGFAGDLSLQTNPSNTETFTLVINGTSCVFTFVTSIGATPGNVLIGATAAETRGHLAAFINAPGTTNGDQVAFTGAQLTALGYVNAVDDLSTTIFVKALVSTVTSFSGSETMAGANNTWTANTTKNRIDLLVLETGGSTLQIRRGTEAASPAAPTPTTGDIVLANVYCKIGMASVKDVNDSTNGYIAAWYFPQIYRTDVITTAAPDFTFTKKTLVAGEAITGATTPVPVFVEVDRTSLATEAISYKVQNSTANIYGANWYAQTFLMDSNNAISKVMLRLAKTGNPTGNLNISLYATSGGLPTGAALYTHSVAASTIGAAAEVTFTLTQPWYVTAATTYAIVVSVPNGDASNYIGASYNNTSGYANGQYCNSSNSGSTWGSNTYDFYFSVYTYTSNYAGRVYITKANDVTRRRVTGFAISTAAGAGSNVTVQVSGIVSGFTGLTPGAEYFVTDTGTLSTTPSTTCQISFCKALTATEVFITTPVYMFKGSGSISGQGAASTVVTPVPLGFTPKKVTFHARTSTYNNGGYYTSIGELTVNGNLETYWNASSDGGTAVGWLAGYDQDANTGYTCQGSIYFDGFNMSWTTRNGTPMSTSFFWVAEA